MKNTTMTGAKIIASALYDLGIRKVYMYPGGTIAPLLYELVEIGIEFICMKHEQGAGFAAIGAAKETGVLQVVMVTSGPGATNLVTCVADAYYDSVPILAITGQVGTADINVEKKIRQTGFQETDTVSIMSSISKKAFTLKNEDVIATKIAEAYKIATSGRKGPVVIDLPMDVQRNTVSEELSLNIKTDNNIISSPEIDRNDIETINNYLKAAERPLIIAGNGIYLSNTIEKFRSFVEQYNIPCVVSLPGIGVINYNAPNYVGMVGHTGEFYANLALYHCDVLLVLGARLDLRQTGSEIKTFIQNKKIIKIDIDKNELEYGRVKSDFYINSELSHFFDFTKNIKYEEKRDLSGWVNQISDWKKKYHSEQFYIQNKLNVKNVVEHFNRITQDQNLVVTTGVGNHQQLVARYFQFDAPSRSWQTSSGHGTMGYDLPAIFGATESTNDKIGLCFVGDGSFMLNVQELASIKEKNLPVIIILLNNNRLGIVSQFQLMNWETDLSTGKKVNPDFILIAQGFGFNTIKVKTLDDLKLINETTIQISQLPLMIECELDEKEDVLPMLLGGQHLNEMYPMNKRVGINEEII